VLTIPVNLGSRSYEICIDSGCLGRIGTIFKKDYYDSRITIITDSNVNHYYGSLVEDEIRSAGLWVNLIEIPPGEESKSLAVIESLYDKLLSAGIERNSVIAALGGGVVGDIAGFAAATVLRGVRYVQIPTTLLAQTDSSVGGKVGINHTIGKNLIGAFYQPQSVIIDPEVLRTLPERELAAGLAEVVKYGLIWDADFFEYMKSNGHAIVKLSDMDCVQRAIARSCEIKAEIVSRDEKESDLRRILNFGHTVGHALEACEGYDTFLHGEAVWLGIVAAARISRQKKYISEIEFHEIKELVNALALIPDLKGKIIPIENMVECMHKDKKVKEQKINFVLLRKIGETIIDDNVPYELIRSSIEYIQDNMINKQNRENL